MKNRNAFKAKVIYMLSIYLAAAYITSCDKDTKPDDTLKETNVIHSAVDDTAANFVKDSKFLVAAAEINIEDINMGQLAQSNGRMSNVKDLGEKMANLHTKCLTEIKKLALKKQIPLPTCASNEARSDYSNLYNKSGSDFDEFYCGLMVNGHKGAIILFERASYACSDPEIKAFAKATLPVLKEHLNHACLCQRQIQSL